MAHGVGRALVSVTVEQQNMILKGRYHHVPEKFATNGSCFSAKKSLRKCHPQIYLCC
jgi:hypothetical protein